MNFETTDVFRGHIVQLIVKSYLLGLGTRRCLWRDADDYVYIVMRLSKVQRHEVMFSIHADDL